MKKKSLLLIALPLLAMACGSEKKASKLFRNGEFQEVIARYSKVLKNDSDHPEANFFIAESYRQSNRVKWAQPYYRKAIENGLKNDSVMLFYAFSLKANQMHEEAIEALEKFVQESQDEFYTKRANDELSALEYLDDLADKKSYYRVKNLKAVNTRLGEYSPIYNDGYLYFTASRDNNRIYSATGTPFTNIYKAKTRGARVDTTSIESLGDMINNYNINEGTLTFSPDGKTMVFARGNSGKRKGTADVNLYISRLRNGQWTEPRMLNINNPGYWDSCPAFSRDGKTLYFASNRPGGHGGTDIYSARRNARGRFFKVKNLGTQINTTGNEMFPFISDDGRMYFSSDGHPGYGGLDLLVAQRRNGQTVVENLGKPVNSGADDFGLFLFKADRGFFTSNREGGAGDDDIYTFVNEDPNLKVVNYFLEGVTMTHDENEKLRVLPTVKVQLMDFNQEVLDETTTGQDGEFQFRVYEHERYMLVGEKVGTSERFFITRLPFTTVGKAVSRDTLKQLVTNVKFDTTLVLDKIELNKIFALENIYYDYNKYNIRDDAAEELDKLVTMLQDNPEISIELSSHTDSVDTEKYNLWLSQKRAESAVNYIISQGINKDRLIAKGYGESRPIARNTNPDGTDNPEGRQKNRRTEFKILDIAPKQIREPEEGEEDEDGIQQYFDEDRFFDDEEDDTGDSGGR